MAKTPKTTVVKVGDREFKLQHPGVKWYMENTDACRNANGVVQTAKYAQNLLDFVVVDPVGMKVDDFETVGELEEFIQAAETFLRC